MRTLTTTVVQHSENTFIIDTAGIWVGYTLTTIMIQVLCS